MSIPHLFADIKDLHNRMFNTLLLINRLPTLIPLKNYRRLSHPDASRATSPPSTQVASYFNDPYPGRLLSFPKPLYPSPHLIRQSFLFGLERSYSKIHILLCPDKIEITERPLLPVRFRGIYVVAVLLVTSLIVGDGGGCKIGIRNELQVVKDRGHGE